MSYSQRTLRILRLTTLSSIGGAAVGLDYWKIWSRHAYFEPFTPSRDRLFHLPLIKKINPHNNPSIDDSCVYKVPVANIKPELLEDHRRGGPKLVNAFAQGIWGGYGYAIQRKLENLKTRNDTNKNDMWTAEDCLSGAFAVDNTRLTPRLGDVVTDHLLVISRTNNSIITRGGPPPRLTPPDEPRDLDNIGEMRVDLNSEDHTVEFRFKNIFFAGAGGPKLKPPFPRMIAFLHYEYAKLLLHSGVSSGMFRFSQST
ncbi:hypothetical protein FDECE_17368 [Fusarium decemcellulare]|nr:hypothetical protein FDECE_17368 [Fusarium decemcellulare]